MATTGLYTGGPARKCWAPQLAPVDVFFKYRIPVAGLLPVLTRDVNTASQMRMVSLECAGPSTTSPPPNPTSPQLTAAEGSGRPAQPYFTQAATSTPVIAGSEIS